MRRFGFVLLVCALVGMPASCGKDAPSAPTPQPNRPSTITWSPTQAIDGQETIFTLRVTDADGLDRVVVKGLDSEFFVEFTQINAELLMEQIPKTYQLENASAVNHRYDITAIDRLGEQVSRQQIVTIQPAPISNMPPNINVSVSYNRNWQEDPINFRIIANDDFKELSQIKLDFGDGNINQFNVNKKSIDTVLTHQYLQGGEFFWNALAKDTEGLTGQDSGEIAITPLFNINIDTNKITYVGTINGDIVEPDNTARMKFTSRDGSIVKQFEAQNGQITGRIPLGEFEVEYLSDYSKLSRMKVNRNFYPDEWQYLSFMGVDGGEPGQSSFVERGYPANNQSLRPSDQNWYFNVTGDINTRAETVKGAIADQGWLGPQRFIPADELLYMMTHQMNDAGILRVPRTKDQAGNELIQYLVYNKGNPAMSCEGWDAASERPETCVDQKSIERGNIDPSDLPDGGVNPPGVIPRNPQIAEQSFDNYVALMKSIFNSDIVAGNPYNTQIVKGYSPELTEYLNGWYVPTNTDLVILTLPKDNVFFISHNQGAGTEFYNSGVAFGDSFQYTRASSMFVPGQNLPGFLNEATHWFSSREGFPCVYSIRDRTGGTCGGVDFPSGFTDLDIIFNKIAASFGAYSQKQKTGFEREVNAAGSNRDGFTITLPRN